MSAPKTVPHTIMFGKPNQRIRDIKQAMWTRTPTAPFNREEFIMNYLMCTMTCTMTCIMTSFGVVGTEIVSVKRYVNRSVIQFRYQTN